MKNLMAASALAMAFLWAPAASAAPTSYHFNLTMTIDGIGGECIPGWGFGCTVDVGTVWKGHFSIAIDPRARQYDHHFSTPFLHMHIVTGGIYWDHCQVAQTCAPDDDNFLVDGYRDFVGDEYFNLDGPGYYVQNGRATAFAGGFIGASDASWIDFHYPFSGNGTRFTASDEARYVTGTYSITQIPEPSSVALLGGALLGLIGVRRRQG